MKFANFVYISIKLGKKLPFLAKIAAKMVTFSARNTNKYKICKLRWAIFSVFFQHFAAKLCNFANLRILFLAIVKDLVLFT